MIHTICVIAQPNNVSVTIDLNRIDYENLKVCYHISIVNESTEVINLAGQNFRLFYDSEYFELETLELMSLLPTPQYSSLFVVQSIEHLNATGLGNLTFEDDLGFLNFFIDLNNIISGGIELQADGMKTGLAEICFNANISTSDSFCPSIILAREDETQAYANAFIEISEWINSSQQQSLNIIAFDDITPTNVEDCIDFMENTLDACTDGIDNDGDGLIDCFDTSCNSIGITCENDLVSCGDGIDNDGDGDVDCDDLTCGAPSILDIQIIEISDCADMNNGALTIQADGINMVYSIDNGINFVSSAMFVELTAGNYSIVVRNELTGCTDFYINNPIVIEEIECPDDIETDCTDGIDNDQNGFVDCEDLICFDVSNIQIAVDSSCLFEPTGAIFISELNPDYQVSIDNGITFTNAADLIDLASGEYELLINYTLYNCTYLYPEIIVIPTQECIEPEPDIEICFDGVDNDADGLIDCEDSDCMMLMECSTNEVYVPNVFSPRNQDGINDVLTLGINTSRILSIDIVQIYDRWGNQLMELKNLNVDSEIEIWDGSIGGSEVVQGVYSMLVIAIRSDSSVLKKVYSVTIL